jgi:hypothetical protein
VPKILKIKATFLSMVEIHTLPILTADLQHYRPRDSLLEWVSGGEKEQFGPSLMPGGKEAYERLRLSLNP